MLSKSFICLELGLLFVTYLPFQALGAVHEQLAAAPAGWSYVSTPDDDQSISLQIGLQEQNLDQLETKLYAVSTPGDSSYGQHMDRDSVAAMLQPSAESNEAVLAWLKEAGVTSVSSDGSWVNLTTTVETANKILNTEFSYYGDGATQKLRTLEYSLPDNLVEHVDLIVPTTFFGRTTAAVPVPIPQFERKLINSRQIDASCAQNITPQCLKELYNVHYTANSSSGSNIGFGSFLNQSARYTDLALFEKAFSIPSQNFSVELINGGVNDQAVDDNHGEANLDVENIIGISHPLPVREFITGGSPPFIPNIDEPTVANNTNEPYLPYYQYLTSKADSELPQVITNSYGDDEQTVPPRYAKRVCNLIGQLGLRGITVLESAGDTGVGAPCQSNDGKKTPQFTPQFPGTCPYITAVGGTQSIEPEVAWVAGSGGFSNYFARAYYQEDAVSNYLANEITPATLAYFTPFFNQSGRAFPDVSAHSLTPDYLVFVNNEEGRSGGTSAASPVFAAIVGLLNDARFRAGKPSVGFLNPFLYSSGYQALTDITGGGSVGCNGINGQTGEPVPGGSIIPFASWNATPGWDPVTGLGTPNFGALRSLVLSL